MYESREHSLHRCSACGQEVPDHSRHGVTLRAHLGEVHRNGRKARLTPALMMVLECLVDAYPGVTSRREIFEALYSDRDKQPREHIVQVLMAKLRRSLAPLGIKATNVWGYGYRMELTSRRDIAPFAPSASQGAGG